MKCVWRERERQGGSEGEGRRERGVGGREKGREIMKEEGGKEGGREGERE